MNLKGKYLFNRIWVKFAASVVITLVASITITGIITTMFEQRTIESRIHDELESTLNLTSKVFSNSLWNYDLDLINSLTDAMFEREIIQHIVITDHTRGIVIDTISSNFEKESDTLQYGKRDILINEVPIGYVEVGISSTSLYEQLSKQQRNRMIQSILETGILTLIVIILSYSITKPISILRNELVDFANGSYSKAIPENRTDEIGKLTSAFNKMARQIEESDSSLKAFNTSLEKLVESRTEELCQSNLSLNDALALSQEIQAQLTVKNDELEEAMLRLQQAYSEILEVSKGNIASQLIAGLAHEVNTPLGVSITSITYQMNLIEKFNMKYLNDVLTKSGLEEFIENIKEISNVTYRNLNHANELIANFKLIAVDQVSQRKRLFNLKHYLTEVLDNIKPAFKSMPYEIHLNCIDEIVLNSNPGVFAQIVTNLVMNSIKHGFKSRETGLINIELIKTDDQLVINYEDDGNGISPESLDKVFIPFYSSEHNQGGSGLGLSVIKNLIEVNLEGTITCESELGDGVQFKISVPYRNLV